jgi:cell division protein FtsQ
MAPGLPADRNFRRAQVKPTRRRGWRRLLSWRLLRAALVLVVLVYAGYRAVALVAGAGGLRVSQITVRGNTRLSTGEVLAVVAGLRGQNILLADLDGQRARLAESPWVARASLRRVLPSTVEVEITERVPMGLGRLGGRLYLVDAGGVAIDEYGPQYAEFDLPIIDGLSEAGAPGGTTDARRVALAARVMAALDTRPDLAQAVSQIDVTDPRDAVVILDGDSALLHLGDARFVERLQAYLELAPTLRERVPAIDYVDLRFDERVYVRPGRSPETVTPAAQRR